MSMGRCKLSACSKRWQQTLACHNTAQHHHSQICSPHMCTFIKRLHTNPTSPLVPPGCSASSARALLPCDSVLCLWPICAPDPGPASRAPLCWSVLFVTLPLPSAASRRASAAAAARLLGVAHGCGATSAAAPGLPAAGPPAVASTVLPSLSAVRCDCRCRPDISWSISCSSRNHKISCRHSGVPCCDLHSVPLQTSAKLSSGQLQTTGAADCTHQALSHTVLLALPRT